MSRLFVRSSVGRRGDGVRGGGRVAPVDHLRFGRLTYISEEAETTMTVAIDGDTLVLKQRPDTTLILACILALLGSLGQAGCGRDNARQPVSPETCVL